MHAHKHFPRAAIAILGLAGAAGAHAASFDCKAARTSTEKAICGSPKLSALDEKLAAAYERATHALSPAGAAQLKASQRGWLRFVTQVCVPRQRDAGAELPADCLAPEFGRRIDELAMAGVRLGPWTFNRIDAYAAVRAPLADGGQYGGFVWQHVAFPQIDAPSTPAAAAWNKAQQKGSPGELSAPTSADDPVEDDDTDYTLGCAGERFISVRVDTSEYQHGAAHGSYDHAPDNALLVPALRKMGAADIFAPGAPWKTRLPGLFWDAYRHEPDAVTDVASIEEAIKASAVNPDAWLLTPDGLQVAFGADEAGCYACNPGPVTVPWAVLKPMLAAPDLATCEAPPATRP